MICKPARPWNDTGTPLLRVIRTPNTRSITTTLSSSIPNQGSASAGDTTCKPFAANTRPGRRALSSGGLSAGATFWVTEYVITYDGRRVNTVSIMELQAGKVARETQYFAEPFEPPAWRAQWVERMA